MTHFERSVLGMVAIMVGGLSVDTLEADPSLVTAATAIVLMLCGLGLVLTAAWAEIQEARK
jgi:hypothetical protein